MSGATRRSLEPCGCKRRGDGLPRRAFIGLGLGSLLGFPAAAVAARPPLLDEAALAQAVEDAASLPRLRTLMVWQHGAPALERAFRGPGLDQAQNVKSVAKTVISALVGIAIDRDVLEGVDQRIAPILRSRMPTDVDPKVAEITVDHLLTMRAGLERTSGPGYGRWVSSRDWVGYALSRPFVDQPGGRMLYSTGSTHILSAVLTEASGRSTLALARDWLGEPLDITIPAWTRDPQGIYMGGNNMALSPRALLRLGETYRQGGVIDGRRVLPEDWVRRSWTPRVRSPFTGDEYGYGWFVRDMTGHPVHYGWGYGGQMLYVVPSLGLTVVMTSDPDHPSGRDGYVQALHALLADRIIPAAALAGPSAAVPARRSG